jgi:vitamin B12/bleomycin/antimicrobial peptide transport system ATP-binding/permease protein
MRGTITLGEVAEASAAFVSVQTALNRVVGNFQHLADWTASASRVAALLLTWDGLDGGGDSRPRGAAEAECRSGPPDGKPAGGRPGHSRLSLPTPDGSSMATAPE